GVDHRIVDPALLAALRIEGEYPIEASRQEEASLHQDRRGFEASALPVAPALGDIAYMKCPRDFKTGDVFTIDLRQRRIPRPARVVAVIRPVVRRLRQRSSCACAGKRKNSRNQDCHSRHMDSSSVVRRYAATNSTGGEGRILSQVGDRYVSTARSRTDLRTLPRGWNPLFRLGGVLMVEQDLLPYYFERSKAPEVRRFDIVVGVGIPAFVGSNVFIELIDDQEDGLELLGVGHEGVEGNVGMAFAIAQGVVWTVGRSVR